MLITGTTVGIINLSRFDFTGFVADKAGGTEMVGREEVSFFFGFSRRSK